MHLLKKKNGVSQPYSLTQSFKHLLSEAYIYTTRKPCVYKANWSVGLWKNKAHTRSKSTCEKRGTLSWMLTTASPEVSKPTLSKMKALEKLNFYLLSYVFWLATLISGILGQIKALLGLIKSISSLWPPTKAVFDIGLELSSTISPTQWIVIFASGLAVTVGTKNSLV